MVTGGEFAGDGPGHGGFDFFFVHTLESVELPGVSAGSDVVADDLLSIETDDETVVAAGAEFEAGEQRSF